MLLSGLPPHARLSRVHSQPLLSCSCTGACLLCYCCPLLEVLARFLMLFDKSLQGRSLVEVAGLSPAALPGNCPLPGELQRVCPALPSLAASLGQAGAPGISCICCVVSSLSLQHLLGKRGLPGLCVWSTACFVKRRKPREFHGEKWCCCRVCEARSKCRCLGCAL